MDAYKDVLGRDRMSQDVTKEASYQRATQKPSVLVRKVDMKASWIPRTEAHHPQQHGRRGQHLRTQGNDVAYLLTHMCR